MHHQAQPVALYNTEKDTPYGILCGYDILELLKKQAMRDGWPIKYPSHPTVIEITNSILLSASSLD
ncbi:MAG: hypothetical protein ACKO96_37160 [Flammeovirgaceae bacterium]